MEDELVTSQSPHFLTLVSSAYLYLNVPSGQVKVSRFPSRIRSYFFSTKILFSVHASPHAPRSSKFTIPSNDSKLLILVSIPLRLLLTMTPAETYQYQPIDLATDAIRLLRVLKGSYVNPLRCTLLQSYLDRDLGVPYEALSYTWGDLSVAKVPLLVFDEKDGVTSSLYIYPNLYNILEHLRSQTEDRFLWVDAVCIDQNNHKERSHQVAQMRLVYERAERVVAWLGGINGDEDASAADICRLLDYAKNLDWQAIASLRREDGASPREDELENVRVQQRVLSWGLNFDKSSNLREAMSLLLARPWFTRVWVIQEVASARAGTIVWGRDGLTKSAPMRNFALLPSIMGIDVSYQARAILDIMPLVGQRRQGWWNEKRDLPTLLGKFTASKCSDPRDFVFALLGIASDERAREVIKPDYELSLEEVIKSTLLYVVSSSSSDVGALSLHILRRAFISETHEMVATSVSRYTDYDANGVGRQQADLLRECGEIVRSLLSKNTGHPKPSLNLAVEEGDEEAVAFLLSFPGIDLELRDSRGYNALHRAAAEGDVSILKLLIAQQNVDIKSRTRFGQTALGLAASREDALAGNDEIVRLLLEYYDSEADADDRVLRQIYNETRHPAVLGKLNLEEAPRGTVDALPSADWMDFIN